MHTLPSTFKTFVIEDSMRFLYLMVCFILPISGLQQIICHVDTDTVSCDLYSVMTITSSTYGRYDETTCTGGHGQYHGGFPCIMDSTNWVKQKCENKQTCSINPTSIGTDPCENYNKYMTVWYTCSDIDECASNPCQNGGICIDMINEYTCTCDTGYAGTNCEENINECASSPCQHGGTCTDGINGYTCACVQGYTGNNCEENIDECGSNPCQHGGTCTDVINGYTCNCDPAYKGTDCSESNDLFDINYTLEEHQSTHMSLKALLVMSRLNCARICTLNHDCYGFEYNAIDNTCQMISAISTGAFGKVNYYVKQF